MRLAIKTFVIPALVIAVTGPAYALENVEGGDLVTACQADEEGYSKGFCQGYIAAFADAHQAVAAASGVDLFCPPDGISYQQVETIVVDWLEDNPSESNQSLHDSVFLAVRDAFPCED